ncbi:MAG: ribosomal protein S12 methylthiotransferase RimO [Acidobacteria bacterium RIFCSPLOWO2_02_FULL_67_36]|nr:MAG: ribosomal protein S12 methylthiotransferase RimO [Acidobacteria bacterium RIFCSPLOWO2_02_FULL_67_36]OFW26480.1 MAG: ribosomal protein S12 methylthiotransferase RimO [Acidobacteria bacterium RIFCSPLOWO2_12_FULL_66_21]
MKIGFVSLGCPKNLVDGEVMLGIARDAGHEITPEAADADVLVVNTCAFIDSAKQESIDAILKMAGQKRDGRCSRLVVTGCLAERYRDELKREIPEIDAVLGTGEVPDILDAIGGRASQLVARGSWLEDAGDEAAPLTFYSKRPSNERRATSHEPRTTASPTYLYDADTPRLQTTPRHFAYVKIAEGCDYTCAFCIIPTLRGQYRSRTADSIVREARMMAERGVRELLLISQDTTFYGIDRGERGALARLLRALNAIDGLRWIRLLYLYPTTITDDVLDAMADCDKVCRYIDLPLQHASASVLKRMRRPGNRRSYETLLARIRARVPGVTLRTTLIVGFPGEDEEDFAELDSFVASTAFDHVGVFTYSHEEGTRAFDLPDDVPAAVKRRRRNALMSRQKRIVRSAQKARIGSDVSVMVDGRSREHELVRQGRLEGQAPEIDPVVFLTDCDLDRYQPGDLIRARVVGARDYDLLVTPVSQTANACPP